ncbi:LysR family transcriptional regulator [Leucobacter tenebrionis]|uniref:LysR family transcriptional regulator n=1 Tax=Leucobacter tenebrionis TaxID=2873270 RepID=UPI001CA6417A|nr:LysR family transcriptional regulator [Leucobacter tenebrionis]QZY51756.1 LysR family transcriptional regulator [Leucobacter tenebrionis]
MIDLRQLQALRAVHAEGSVTGAARRLAWSQPTVDYHLKNLDRLVGSPVIQRSARGSSLTPVGVLLLDRGEEILSLTDRALRDARDLTHMGRVRLRFGTFPTAAARLLPSIVSQVDELGIEVDAVLAEVAPLIDQVHHGTLDAVLVYSVPGYDLPFRNHLAVTEVHRDPLMLALPAGHPLAVPGPIDVPTLLSLHDERWLFGATGEDPMDTIVIDAFREAGHSLDVSIRSDDFQVLLGMVAARMIVGMVPKLAVGSSHSGVQLHPGVVLRPVAHPDFARSLLLAAPGEGARRQPSTAVRQLAVAIRDSLAALD